MKCEDCGAEVERRPPTEGWGQRRERQEDDAWAEAWDYACRVEYDPDVRGRLLAVDYHYVRGETQKHFRAKPQRSAGARLDTALIGRAKRKRR